MSREVIITYQDEEQALGALEQVGPYKIESMHFSTEEDSTLSLIVQVGDTIVVRSQGGNVEGGAS